MLGGSSAPARLWRQTTQHRRRRHRWRRLVGSGGGAGDERTPTNRMQQRTATSSPSTRRRAQVRAAKLAGKPPPTPLADALPQFRHCAPRTVHAARRATWRRNSAVEGRRHERRQSAQVDAALRRSPLRHQARERPAASAPFTTPIRSRAATAASRGSCAPRRRSTSTAPTWTISSRTSGPSPPSAPRSSPRATRGRSRG